MTNGSPLLSIEHVSKEFYGNVVLHDVNFDLSPGEILGLVGENGAGKTTLMRILLVCLLSQRRAVFRAHKDDGNEAHFLSLSTRSTRLGHGASRV